MHAWFYVDHEYYHSRILSTIHSFIFIFSVFQFGCKNTNFLKFLQLKWWKKMPSNFALLKHTAPPQASEQAQWIVMSNKFLQLLELQASWFWEKLAFVENNLITVGMVKVLQIERQINHTCIKVEGNYLPRKRDSPRTKTPKIDASTGVTRAYAASKMGPRLWIDQHRSTLFMPEVIRACQIPFQITFKGKFHQMVYLWGERTIM